MDRIPAALQRDDQLPRGRHSLEPAEVAGNQRRRLMEATVAVVAERGYPETRVKDLIDAAGVSRKTFYELFADKEECFLAAYDGVLAEVGAAMQDAYDTDPERPWPERVSSAFGAMLELFAAKPAAGQIMVVSVLGAGEKALARRDAAIRDATYFVDGGRAATGRDLPGTTSLGIVGGIYELIHSELLHGGASRLPGRLPDITYWIVLPYLGPAAAKAESDRVRSAQRSS